MSTHKWAGISGIVPKMGLPTKKLPIEKLLSENLSRIFGARGITSAVKAATALQVPKSTIDRAWHFRSMARIDTVEDVARGLKLQAWQLLVPNFDPANPPRLEVDQVAEEKARAIKPQREEEGGAEVVLAAEIIELATAYVKLPEGRRRLIMESTKAAADAVDDGRRDSADNKG